MDTSGEERARRAGGWPAEPADHGAGGGAGAVPERAREEYPEPLRRGGTGREGPGVHGDDAHGGVSRDVQPAV